uniref:Uncharacterized protein n=1 Tax=Glossina palpalis gambiensis TaxID=67801 RepID=A0A1B0AWB1_9MUSC
MAYMSFNLLWTSGCFLRKYCIFLLEIIPNLKSLAYPNSGMPRNYGCGETYSSLGRPLRAYLIKPMHILKRKMLSLRLLAEGFTFSGTVDIFKAILPTMASVHRSLVCSNKLLDAYDHAYFGMQPLHARTFINLYVSLESCKNHLYVFMTKSHKFNDDKIIVHL